MTNRAFLLIHDGLTEVLSIARGETCPHCLRPLTIAETIERHCVECRKDTDKAVKR